jgi:adenylate cyclase
VAKATAEKFLSYIPSFSTRRWVKNEPYEDIDALEDYVDGLRKAGIPE